MSHGLDDSKSVWFYYSRDDLILPRTPRSPHSTQDPRSLQRSFKDSFSISNVGRVFDSLDENDPTFLDLSKETPIGQSVSASVSTNQIYFDLPPVPGESVYVGNRRTPRVFEGVQKAPAPPQTPPRKHCSPRPSMATSISQGAQLKRPKSAPGLSLNTAKNAVQQSHQYISRTNPLAHPPATHPRRVEFGHHEKTISPDKNISPVSHPLRTSVRGNSSSLRVAEASRVRQLVHNLKIRDREQQKTVVAIVLSLSSKVEYQDILNKEDVIPSLIDLLTSEDSITRKQTAFALTNLSLHDSNLESIVRNLGCHCFIYCLNQSEEPAFEKRALDSILRLSTQGYDFASSFIDAGGLEALIMYIRSNRVFQPLATQVIVSFSEVSPLAFITRRVASCFPGFLKSADTLVKLQICTVITNLMKSGEFDACANDNKLQHYLVEVVSRCAQDGTDETLTLSCLKALRSFCSNGEFVAYFVSSKIHQYLASFLRSKHRPIQYEAIHTISAATKFNSYCEILKDDGGSFQIIVNMNASTNRQLKYSIAQTIYNISINKYTDLLIASDAISALVTLSRSSDPDLLKIVGLALGSFMMLDHSHETCESTYEMLVNRGALDAMFAIADINEEEVVTVLARSLVKVLGSVGIACDQATTIKTLLKLGAVHLNFVTRDVVEGLRHVAKNNGIEFLEVHGAVSYLTRVAQHTDTEPTTRQAAMRILSGKFLEENPTSPMNNLID